jgi:hypothetical protein
LATQTIIPSQVNEQWAQQCRPTQMQSIASDQAQIYQQAFFGKIPSTTEKIYIATAGAPASGKSTILEQELASGQDPRYAQTVKIDPDEYTIPNMDNTRALLTLLQPSATKEDAYHFLRAGSNIIANNVLNSAVGHNYHIAHGSTLSSPQSENLLANIGNAGYTRRLLLCDAPDATRADLEANRQQQGDFHVTAEDFKSKSYGFCKNMSMYFKQGDELKIYWTPNKQTGAILAATYEKGQRTVLNPEALAAFVKNYEQKRSELNQNLPAWQEIEANYAQRFQQTSWVQQVQNPSQASSLRSLH